MNFQIAGPGRSFKGAMAYYLHDKRPAGSEEQVLTRERVAWTETRNLMTDDPDRATRIMIGTAERSEELKAQAGIARTGRKGTQPVMAYSLAWHPGEAAGLDRAEMVRAAEASLKVLGLESHQAVLVAHRDTAHPHVHVIVNRVSPEDGRYATINPAKVRELDRWAHDYEKARAQIVSPNRAEKYERIDERRRRHPDPEARRAHVAERARADEERRGRGASRAAELRETGEAMRARHKAEWQAFGREASAERKAVWARYEAPIKEAYGRAKEDAKPLWKEQFRREREAAWQRRRMERSVFGTMGLALAAAWQERRHSPHGKDWSFTALTLVNLVSRGHREKVFGQAAERDRAKLAGRQKAMTNERVAGLKEQRAGEAARVGERITGKRQALIERQNGERAALRHDWREAGRGQGRRNSEPRSLVEAKRDDPFAAFERERAERAQGGDPFAALNRERQGPADNRGRDREKDRGRER